MNGPGAKDKTKYSEASEPQGVLMNLYALCLNRYNVPLTVLYNMGGAHFLSFLSNSLSNSQVTALFIPQGLLQHLFHAWLQGLLNNTKWPKPISAPSKIACRSESAGGDRIHFC